MRSIFRLAAFVGAGVSVALLSGCVVAPAGPAYGYGYGYSAPQYYAPAPVIVQPSVGFYGRWGGGGRYWR